LEWNYVILIDADMCLINKRYFDEDKHLDDQYLLYVACSRAIKNMYIFSKYTIRYGEYNYQINPHFSLIPEKRYNIDSQLPNFSYPKVSYVNYMNKETSLSRLIGIMDCYKLDRISQIINYENKKLVLENEIYDDYTEIEKNNSIFLSKFVEQLFISIYNIKYGYKQTEFPIIESIITSSDIITGCSEKISEWYFKNRKNITWKKYDKMEISNDIRKFVDNNFDRNKEFSDHTIAINNYYEYFILNDKKRIKKLYKQYLKCKNIHQITDILFNLMVIKHSIQTQHYFHIKNKGKTIIHLLEDFKELFEDVKNYVDKSNKNFIMSNDFISKWEIVTKIDQTDGENNIWNIKCSTDISLKAIIKSIYLSLINNPNIADSEDFELKDNIIIKTNFINFLSGKELVYEFNLKPQNIKELVEILINLKNKN
jgi:hypothetical protein